MANSMRCVGLDVHVRETQAAVLDEGTGELSYRRIRGRPHEVVPYLEGLERPFRAVYEAGPTGYGLARRARERGLDVGVCAPGHILRRRQDRIKTDRRDAERLARLLWAGELRLVLVPEPWQEQLRDVVRCREDLRVDLMRARHRISKLCLRRERYFHGPGRAWTRRHRDWLSGLRFPDRATQLTLSDYMHAHDVLLARRERLEAELFELALASPFASTVRNLRCLRGIDTPSAVGLCCEVLEHLPRPLATRMARTMTTSRQREVRSFSRSTSKYERAGAFTSRSLRSDFLTRIMSPAFTGYPDCPS